MHTPYFSEIALAAQDPNTVRNLQIFWFWTGAKLGVTEISLSSTAIVECLSNTIDSFIGSQFCIIQGLKCGSVLALLVAEFL